MPHIGGKNIMGRRHRQGISLAFSAGDPGRDLFAYLFLLIMVFAFMLLMSFEEAESIQKSPVQRQPGKSVAVQISKDNIASLEVVDSRVYLRFGKALYDPVTDFEKLVRDKKIVTQSKNGKEQRLLYVSRENIRNISLSDYLETFKTLSERDVLVAFAGEIK